MRSCYQKRKYGAVWEVLLLSSWKRCDSSWDEARWRTSNIWWMEWSSLLWSCLGNHKSQGERLTPNCPWSHIFWLLLMTIPDANPRNFKSHSPVAWLYCLCIYPRHRKKKTGRKKLWNSGCWMKKNICMLHAFVLKSTAVHDDCHIQICVTWSWHFLF